MATSVGAKKNTSLFYSLVKLKHLQRKYSRKPFSRRSERCSGKCCAFKVSGSKKSYVKHITVLCCCMFVTLALSDIDFVALERPTPNKSESSLCVKRRILKLYKYYTPTCLTQISSFVIIGFFAVSVDHCLDVERPPKDGHTNPTRHYIFQDLPENDS